MSEENNVTIQSENTFSSDTPDLTKKRKYRKRLKIILLVSLAIILIVIFFSWQVLVNYKKIRSVDFTFSQSAYDLTGNIPNVLQNDMVTIDDPSFGSKEAKIKIVEFSDFQCPFCKKAFPIIRTIMNEYGDQIYYVYRDFPISEIHPDAQKAAEAGECAFEQGKFLPMHDKIFLNQENIKVADLKKYAKIVGLDTKIFNQCLDSGKYSLEVQNDYFDGIQAGVTGTPTFFINGQRIPGVIPLNIFREIIDNFIKEK